MAVPPLAVRSGRGVDLPVSGESGRAPFKALDGEAFGLFMRPRMVCAVEALRIKHEVA